MTDEQREKIRQLETLGYVSGVNKANSGSGVVIYDRSRAWESLNLYVSGHAPGAFLMDMSGNVLHTWSYAYEDAVGESPPTDDARSWRRAYMYPNGDLLAIFEGRALIKVNKDSELQWVYADRCHHQAEVTADGSIYVLSREPRIIKRIHETEPILEDYISVLDQDGSLLKRVSILEWDVLHTNSIRVLNGVNSKFSQAFKKGNVLLSMRELNMLAIVNLEEETVEWVSWGMWATQHDPVLLPNGRMLVFDNRGNRGNSRVMEFDPFTQEVFWEYQGDPPKSFYSRACGANQRLPNGNTLISDSDSGRALEVARDGSIVWMFQSPHRIGEQGDVVARLFDMVRLPREWDLPWLED